MPHGHNKVQQLDDIYDSLIHHLFLPCYLPSSADADFCLRTNHLHEYVLLEYLKDFLHTYRLDDDSKIQSAIQLSIACIERWLDFQKMNKPSVSHLQSMISQLPTGSYLPMYFHAQNAALLIGVNGADDEGDEKEQSCSISAWSVLLPTEMITSSMQSISSYFPAMTYRLPNRAQLMSTVHCELLIDFMKNTIEFPKSYRGTREVTEIREIPISDYVCQWWIRQFENIILESHTDDSIKFKKKHRDQVRWNSGKLPFRRSGLWMSIKVVLQTILTRCLGNIGTIVYKLLITHFLTFIIYSRQNSACTPVSVDLSLHCLRKIARRLNKIEHTLMSLDTQFIQSWIEHVHSEIQKKMNEIIPNMDWQSSIRKDEEQKYQQFHMDTKLFNDEMLYRHSFEALNKYLKGSLFNQSHHKSNHILCMNDPDDNCTISEENSLSLPSFHTIQNQYKTSINGTLIRLEMEMLAFVDRWLNQASVTHRQTEHFQILLRAFEDYHVHAMEHYCSKNNRSDPIGYSRYIITSLSIIRTMHEKLCSDSRFEQLKFHRIFCSNISNLFEYLVLPNRDDMIRARYLFDYFNQFTNMTNPDLLTDIDMGNSFGVHFTKYSNKMSNVLGKIQSQADKDKTAKIQEIRTAKEKYARLMHSIIDCPCTCYDEPDDRLCRRCRVQETAKNIKVDIYESPIPSDIHGAMAVIFELRMPPEIRHYRDVLWQFENRSQQLPMNRWYEWLRVLPHSSKLQPHFTGPSDYKVKLVSSINPVHQRLKACPPIASASIEDFLYENSLEVAISPIQLLESEEEQQILTPCLDHADYKPLQYTIATTDFLQNRVIADLSRIQSKLKPKQMIEFGTFRSGHRLQWWNLLAMLESDSLSLNDESVAVLIVHSILQHGPILPNSKILISTWCSESHEHLLDDFFVDELIIRLHRYLDDCASNWQNELALLNIVLITMRILTLCNSTQEDKVIDMVMKCRRVGEQWIHTISSHIHNISSLRLDQVENLRQSIVIIGVACLFTFATHSSLIHKVLNSNLHIISLLKAATTTHDHKITNKKLNNSSIFLRDMIRFSECVLVQIQPILNGLLRKSCYKSLNEFIAIYWATTQYYGAATIPWKKRHKNIHDGWYDGQYKSSTVSIDCVQGIFLVNGMSVGYLPEKIIQNELYRRVFGDYIFPVQLADSFNSYITKYSYHQDERIQYEFKINEEFDSLLIFELNGKKNEIYQLIPPQYFYDDLPAVFISQYSHWKNQSNQTIEFRPIQFSDPHFVNYKPYSLHINTGFITTNPSMKSQIMINRSSAFFQNLFSRYFTRLDDYAYVYVLREGASDILEQRSNQTDIIIYIHLSRLNMVFEYNVGTQCFTSREYPDMCIDNNQWLGTLVGLKSGLILSYKNIDSHGNQNHFKFRKLVVPFGQIHARQIILNEHQNVSVERKSSMRYAHQYFVFTLNDRLRIIQPSDSPAGWLYLALLHALTSHPQPDDYTGMTGMERAFQLLNSAGAWSDRPMDSLCLNILHQIAAISPKVRLIRQNPLCMQMIEWHNQMIPYSLQHFGYFLIVKAIIQNSEKLNFMHPSTHSENVLDLPNEKEDFDELSLVKLYWNYRSYYNLIARLSSKLEAEIKCRIFNVSYHLASIAYPNNKAGDQKAHPIQDIYQSGDVRLRNSAELTCFPLSKWLTDEYALNSVWIGLLQLAEMMKTTNPTSKTNQNDRARLILLFDFLDFISNKRGIRRYYLHILKSVLNRSDLSVSCFVFPPFTQYNNIQQVAVTPSAIGFDSSRTANQRRVITEEVKACLKMGTIYKNECHLATSEEKHNIKLLLKSWQLNQRLQLFLISLQNLVSSVSLEPNTTQILIEPQQIVNHSIENQYEMKRKSSNKSINQEVLAKAKAKYLNKNCEEFYQTDLTSENEQLTREFPNEIFSSTSSDIENFFKNQLNKSWKHLQSTHTDRKMHPSYEHMLRMCECYREQSNELWSELITTMTYSNSQLYDLGLLPRLTPFTLVSFFYQIWLDKEYSNEIEQKDGCVILTTDEGLLLGGIIVHWVIEQHMERALYFAIRDKWVDCKKELENTPHVNWCPAENLPWLIFELEMNITIRKIQVDVARHMIQVATSKEDEHLENRVMQMNMGEGKTSIIIPLLALSLCTQQSTLVRVIVLKALLPMNYHLLTYKLGGLLNRRIFPFTCRRDLDFNHVQMTTVFNRFKDAIHCRDIVLASPEDILSFDLLTIDKCRRTDFQTGQLMLHIQNWFKTYVRDILDESDEILHCKYQLIYTIGRQQTIDGNVERWKLIQNVLHALKLCVQNIENSDPTNLYYRSSERKSSFPEIRLLTYKAFPELCKEIACRWLIQKNYRKIDRKCISSFILDVNHSTDMLNNHFSPADIQTFLILRGLLSGEVLYVALQKRYRVNYGINTDPKFGRLMAVPFRAKDVPTERTEFGHPDIGLVLTQLSYYYRGLNECQILQCLERLHREERDPESIYAEWIALDDEHDVPRNIRQWKGVNLKECERENQEIFIVLRYNMLVINYFLNHFVFPREAKQFPHKLVASAWDLSSPLRTKNVTGFSGTNDTQLLLPVHIHQRDLPQLLHTDALVLNHLLQPENENYQSLPMNINRQSILNEIIQYSKTINVILDVGALFIDGTNLEVAIDWLTMSDRTQIDYAIYFESDCIMVCDRQYHHHSFYTSPANERLDRCIIYLDEVHTRGTDFRFPNSFIAAVTLGTSLTKDRFVQACMRMRKLGYGHSLVFWSSNEVHQQITGLKVEEETSAPKSSIRMKDILRWVYKNTEQATWDGLLHWSIQSLSYQRKMQAFQNLQQVLNDSILRDLADQCLESEVLELQHLYGTSKTLQTIYEIYFNRYHHGHYHGLDDIHGHVLRRLSIYGGSQQRLVQSFNEEQQRELEQELEQEQEREREQQMNYVQNIRPCEPILHDQIKQLCDTDQPILNLREFSDVFRPLAHAFVNSSFSDICQHDVWSSDLWISTEFQRVIENKDVMLDPFLRPPRWILFYRNKHVILVNPFEANWLMGQLKNRAVTKDSDATCSSSLRILLPRLRSDQSILANTPNLAIPRLLTPTIINHPLLVQLFVFNGTIYFENTDEQTAYCQCLALCPKPWTALEENAFEDGWIEANGFVPDPEKRILLGFKQVNFESNPLKFLKQLLKHRNNTFISWRSHVGSIIFNATKIVI